MAVADAEEKKCRNCQVTVYIVFYQWKKHFLFFMFDLFVLLPFSAVKKKLLRKNRCLEEKVVIMEETMTNAEAKVKELSGDFFFLVFSTS